jgi:hypothetical protein
MEKRWDEWIVTEIIKDVGTPYIRFRLASVLCEAISYFGRRLLRRCLLATTSLKVSSGEIDRRKPPGANPADYVVKK